MVFHRLNLENIAKIIRNFAIIGSDLDRNVL